MHVLHDFMMMTKSQEYLLAIGAMALFTIFWLVLDRDKRRQ
jgi:hypothetical protein